MAAPTLLGTPLRPYYPRHYPHLVTCMGKDTGSSRRNVIWLATQEGRDYPGSRVPPRPPCPRPVRFCARKLPR